MSYTLRFLPELEDDLVLAHQWYENKASGLGAEFLRIFYAHVAVLQRTPLLFSVVQQDFHRSLLRRFPFACYFRVHHNEVVVYGLFHCARHPYTVNSMLDARHTQ